MEEQNDYLNYPQTPWYEERQNWLFIGGGVLLIALIILGSVLFVRSRNEARLVAVEEALVVKAVEERLNGELTACQDGTNPDTCRENEVIRTATEARSIEICASLQGTENYVSCVSEVAAEKGDVQVCETLEDANSCKDRVYIALAKDQNAYSLCQQISGETLRAACQSLLVGSALQNGVPCEETHLSQESCLLREIVRQAKESADVSLCDRLSEEGAQALCVVDVNDSDLDEDGLSVEEERTLGTDPNKADTDGDGLSDSRETGVSDPLSADTDGDGLPDGEEVLIWGSDPNKGDTDEDGFSDFEETKNGYNPSGEGKIE